MNQSPTENPTSQQKNWMKKYRFAGLKQMKYEKMVELFITTIAVTSVSAILLIFIFVSIEAFPIFGSLLPDWVTDQFPNYFTKDILEKASISKLFLPLNEEKSMFVWQPDVEKFSVIPLIVGSIKATVVAILFAAPLAIGSAVYTSQFANKKLKEYIKPAIELLAGIPSVVLGFFALIVLASWFQDLFGFESRLNTFVAGIALGITIIPIVYTICEDALNSVPKSYIEASLSLGATMIQTVWKVIIPSVLPGIFAAVILGFGRAIGETLIVLLASGNASILSMSFLDSCRTMSATIAAEMGDVVTGSAHYRVLFFLGILLFVFTFILNYIGDLVVHRFKNKFSGQKN